MESDQRHCCSEEAPPAGPPACSEYAGLHQFAEELRLTWALASDLKTMRLRSGAEFAPYYLKRAHCPPAPSLDSPISTVVDVEPLLRGATAQEDLRFEEGEDDSEGVGVTSTPLTESEDEGGVPAQPQLRPTSGTQSGAKKRRNARANERRAKKRVRLATSGHQPHAYAANPTTAAHHAEELKPLRVSADAEHFPASGSGSWVGVRKKGVKKRPWTVAELVEKKFTFVEWDGR